ncbi:hypothetical protein HNQ94_001387 [Salirhabdus euzebyi]|uniref:Flagellar hook-length control protein FliK n=1 Tax=Salirhabdus euzebyi TaxID=394506 RepID=A0A841Q3G8_9BACI|nr:hypothetical protein [Salirhabdus euzebyi]MBB6452941.1 hypothetical protein [Salirhabdus euzebyi]
MKPVSLAKTLQSIRTQNITQLQLRSGQMITGKVEKFYPDNKVLVQIGNQKLIAQLESQLQANMRYIFQVKQTKPYLLLQVISEKPIKNLKDIPSVLLKKLGIKETEAHRTFLQFLLDEQVPIDKDTLSMALSLFDDASNKKEAKTVLIEMLKREFPITKPFFDAMQARLFQSISLSDTIESLLPILDAANTEHTIKLKMMLQSILSQQSLMSTKKHLGAQILHEISLGDTTTFTLLKVGKLLPADMEFTEWKHLWLQWAQQNGIHADKAFTSFNGNVDLVSFPLNIDLTEEFFIPLKSLWDKQLFLTAKQAYALQNRNGKEIDTVLASIENIPSNTHKALLVGETQLEQLLQQQLSAKQQRIVLQWLLNGLELLYEQGKMSEQQLFYLKFKGFLSLIGEEVVASQSSIEANPSLKELLLAPQLDNNQTQKLLTVFSAMRLSLTESQEWTQFSIQFPGYLFGLKQDITMDFEGKQSEGNKINPSYCRVLFYLQLNQLEETIIDMKIQNKRISLTVYNEHPTILEVIGKKFEPKLTEGITSLGFTLTGVKMKPIKMTSTQPKQYDSSINMPIKGVDFKV